jgi:hypothetical protein
VVCPWCQILIDDPAQRDERTFKRLVLALPVAGDVIDLGKERVVVTRVSLSSPSAVRVGLPVASVHCRAQ